MAEWNAGPMKATFANLVEVVAFKSDLPKAKARRVLECFFDQLSMATWATGKAFVPGLGTFRVRARKPRNVLDPEKPAAVGYASRRVRVLPSHRVVVCRVAKSWRRRA